MFPWQHEKTEIIYQGQLRHKPTWKGPKWGGRGHEKNKQLDCVNQHCNKFRATTIEQLRFFLILIKKNQPINRVKYYMN
jgi:hypothetical protein